MSLGEKPWPTATNQIVSDSQKKLVRCSSHVRQRPGMYFGTGGSAAIPVMTSSLMDAVLKTVTEKYRGPVEVSVADHGKRQYISVYFAGLNSKIFSTTNPSGCLDTLLGTHLLEIRAVAGASNHFKLETCDGKRRLRLEIRNCLHASTKVVRGARTPLLRITFHPVKSVFDRLSHDGLYCIAGRLRDLSLLRPGMATHLHADDLDGDLRFFYQHGLQSQLFEEPYTPHVPHPGCLSFKATSQEMSVEGHIRFLHVGAACVRSYVNGYPVQGGDHLAGLGLALREMNPNSSTDDCRIIFITNPGTGERVLVPMPFVGVLNLRVADMRWEAPTRDIVKSKAIKEFIRMAASAPLRRQWQALRGG